MRKIAVLLSLVLLSGCGGGPVTSLSTPLSANSKILAKDMFISQDDGIDAIMDFLLQRSHKSDFGPPTLVLFPKTDLHVTADASDSIPVDEDGNMSVYVVADLVANGKLEIDNSDPDSSTSRSGYWLAMARTHTESGLFDLVKQQRDYYAKKAGKSSLDDMDKVAKFDVKLIDTANHDAQGGDGIGELVEMRSYYSDAKKAPNDGKSFQYHHDQLLLVCNDLLAIGSQNGGDFDILTDLRDFFENCPDEILPDDAERAQKIAEVNTVINRIFGVDALARRQAVKL